MMHQVVHSEKVIISKINIYRLQLAVLHFNENSNRAQATTKQGEGRYDIIFPKYKKGGYTVRKVTEDATYGKIGTYMYNVM